MEDSSFLLKLPSDITIDILSRLPIRTIISCKCVCKSLYQLLETPDFIKLHLSKSVPGLIVYEVDHVSSQVFRLFEDEHKPEQHEFYYVPVTEFDRSAFITHQYTHIRIDGSVNGFLFLRDIHHSRPEGLYICNPVTREFIILPNPKGNSRNANIDTYGFGVSKITHQYKVVQIYQEYVRDPETTFVVSIPMSECRVYTLGTSSWRSFLINSSHEYNCHTKGVFVKGNLHWLVFDLKGPLLISCFDLETEVFKTFSPPPPYLQGTIKYEYDLCCLAVLGDRLCFVDSFLGYQIAIWIMKEYGVERSWTKEFVITKLYNDDDDDNYDEASYLPIKVLKSGTVLLQSENGLAVYYSKTKTLLSVTMSEEKWFCKEAILHVFSLLSLKSFAMENVVKF